MNDKLPGFIDSLPEHADRRARIPMQRCGRANEVAELIAALASDKPSCITGQNIRIDGGITRSLQRAAGRDPGQKREPGWLRNSASSAVDTRPSSALRCG